MTRTAFPDRLIENLPVRVDPDEYRGVIRMNTPDTQNPAQGNKGSTASTNESLLQLTDFLDAATLQEVQDSFTAVTHFATVIRDAEGQAITQPTDTASLAIRDETLGFLLTDEDIAGGGADVNGDRFSAPIVVDGHVLGSIAINPPTDGEVLASGYDQLCELAQRLGVPSDQIDPIVRAILLQTGPSKAAGVQFLYLLANNITRLCYKDVQLRQRMEELSALYRISTMLAGQRDMNLVMANAAKSIAEVMKVKAVSIRMLDDAGRLLNPRATFGLSEKYSTKGVIDVRKSEIFSRSMRGEVVMSEDLHNDPRVMRPEYAKAEGLVSMLCAGMVYLDRPIGTIQVFTGEARRFSRFDVDLLRAIAQLLSAAIQNARLHQRESESRKIQRQVTMAAAVQQRMLPKRLPTLQGFEIASRYVPSAELSGDFYDFIGLEGNIGFAIGDVVGKGIAASLLMASVRASLRAFAQDLYNIDEIIARVNKALCRDTLDNEFATLFYGVIDPTTRRLTFCNAGHEAPLLLRNGKFIPLETGGMIVGVDPTQHYDRGILDLKRGDLLLAYTDGLADALNFQGQRFGKKRIMDAMRDVENESAHVAMNHVLWQMRRFAGLNDRTDDTTLVCIKAV